MNKVIVFAVSASDANEKCKELGLEFDQVIWVMNYQLLGDLSLAGYTVHFTETFKQMPAYTEAKQQVDSLGPVQGELPFDQ